MVVFREARRTDVPDIVSLLLDDQLGQARETTELARYFSAFNTMRREHGNRLVVGEQEDRIVACYQLTAITSLSRNATRRAQVEGVRVAPRLRGNGIGTALMRDAESRARAMGCGLLQLTSDARRDGALRFYERLGFTPSHIGFKRDLT